MQNKFEPVFILLAAGKSQRFGGNKLLARLASGKTVLQQSYENILAVSDNILLVVNSTIFDTRAASTLEVLASAVFADQSPEKFAHKVLAFSSEGVGDSIAAAVSHTADESAGWVFCLADMPFIQTRTWKAFYREVEQHRDSIVRTRYVGTSGHPVYFPRKFFRELCELTGDVGAREIIARHQHCLHWLDVEDQGVLRDIDRRQDLIN